MSLTLLQSPSPNFNDRVGGVSPRYIMLHYTGMPEPDSARARLCDPAAEVSAHYLIERDGKTWQLVAENDRAWHAGKGCWQGEADMNSASIGIELVNRGHQWGYQPFPAAQIAACRALVLDIMKRRSIRGHNVIGHSDSAPQRKEDPGEFFPWEQLARDGIGFWPDRPSAEVPVMDYSTARRLLRQIGYDCAADGEYDLPLRRVLLAFQRHWLPHHLSGLADSRTAQALQTVATAFAGFAQS